MELNEVLALVKEYLKISKDLSMLLEGTGSFIHNYNAKTHRIHGKVDTLSCVTHRCSHNSPKILGFIREILYLKSPNTVKLQHFNFLWYNNNKDIKNKY